MVALSERRSRRDVKSVWIAKTTKGIGSRRPRKGLDREHRERDWTAKTAKGIGPRTPRKGLDREHHERDWTANTTKGIGPRKPRKGAKDAKGFVLFAMFRAFRVPMFLVRR